MPAARMRGRPLPALGLPAPRERSRSGVVASVLFHAALLALILVPITSSGLIHIEEIEQGAGGPGPAGGGGGGRRGTGGQERIKFVQVAVAPPAAVPEKTAVVPPVVPPPTPEIKPVPQVIPTPIPDAKAEATAATRVDIAPIAGVGGGTGSDGSTGSGPGSGGGFGSGIGTGRGSGVGPGTGGGTAENYPPTPQEFYLPPLPAPSKLKGFRLLATFDVDERGRVLSIDFTRSPDRKYNEKLEESLRNLRFRPGTTPAGTPVRMKAQISYEF